MASIHPYKKKNKTYYEYRIRFKDPFTGKYKEKSKKNFTSSKEAQIAAAEVEKQLMEGFEQTSISLKEYLNFWLDEYKKKKVRKNTYIQHKQNIDLHIVPYFKNILLNNIRPLMYQKFINNLESKDYSSRTIHIIHTTMHNALEQAVTWEKIERNPTKGADLPEREKRAKETQFIDSGDIPIFLTEAYKYGYIYWIFFKTLIDTGMRKGEAAALQWTDIDLKERTITINKSLDFQAKSREELFGDTKTYSSNRTITISQTLANELLFHLKYQNQNKLALKDLYHHDLNLVFCRDDGNFMPKSSLFNAFSRTLKRAGLPSLPIHSTRHTHTVLLMEAGADPKYIQERLGHGSMRVTTDVYSHISKRLDTSSMQKYEDYMKSVLG